MVYIEVDEKSALSLLVKNTDSFHDVVQELKGIGFKWNEKTFVWKGKASLYKPLIESLTLLNEPTTMSTKSLQNLDAYYKNVNRLVMPTTRRVFLPTLMSYPPLSGKHPFEKYQSIDIQRALNQNRFLFNWEMGLGKSYATAALIEHLRYYKEIDKCIIFSTGIGTFNLRDELVKLGSTIRAEEFLVITSIQDYKFEDRDLFNTEKYPQKIFIMTYDNFKSICDYYYDKEVGTKKKPHPSRTTHYEKCVAPIAQWFGNFKGALFADESHSIANSKSNRARIIDSHSDAFYYVYEFTGTFADKYEKQYAQLRLLDPAITGDLPFTGWLRGYCDVGNKYSDYGVNKNGWKFDELKKLNDFVMTKYAAKRLMDECLDLPPDYEVPTPRLDMSSLHREIYESFSNQNMKRLAQEATARATPLTDKVINSFSYFQIALDNPSVLKTTPRFETAFSPELQKKILKFNFNRDSVKAQYLDAVIDERVDDEEEKGIIWFLHPATGDALVERYKKRAPLYICESVPKEDRLALVKKWCADPKSKLLIASLNVLNTSATITEARWQFYIERTYDYTVYKQTRGRIHRPSKKFVSRTYWGLYANSIDFLQNQNLETKGELVSKLYTRKFITQEEWAVIFNLNGTLKMDGVS